MNSTALKNITGSITTSATSPGSHSSPTGSITLTPFASSKEGNFLQDPTISSVEEHTYAFRAPHEGDSRGPCPALNVLAAHGYLPRNGCNISAADLLTALQNPETYNLSAPLAQVLVRGGLGMMHKLPILSSPISLHDLAEHGRIEHDASMVHKDTATGHIYAPTRCDTMLLNDLLEDKEFITLEDIAKRRVLLERQSNLDLVHQEVARGEWALVLDIFGREHGGSVPSDFLRVWLKENRFPDGWKPTHHQGLWATVTKGWAIHRKMNEYMKEEDLHGMDVQHGGQEEEFSGEAERGLRRESESATPNSRPNQCLKTIDMA